jgi:hypothetical protein
MLKRKYKPETREERIEKAKRSVHNRAFLNRQFIGWSQVIWETWKAAMLEVRGKDKGDAP